MTRRPTGEAGDTLVEILVALAVLSIGIVALVGALTTNVTTTVVNRDQSQAEAALVSATEWVKTRNATQIPFSCGGTPIAISVTDVPRNAAYSITYGPATPVDGLPCAKLVAVPVRVVGNGFDRSVDVVRRAS